MLPRQIALWVIWPDQPASWFRQEPGEHVVDLESGPLRQPGIELSLRERPSG